ncbi:MAG: FecR domain-containing protein [Verrucomicrobia bacterium]|nr:FecR domain-containing protein [Verrucomicrobiota bacterium]MDA1065850.1 FecR domain-containing protein [Verrucomicrobiota bacterium]
MFENKDSLTRRELKIRKLASDWLVEGEEGWDPGREAEFNAWKAEDIRHEIALQDMQATWSRLQQLRHLKDDPNLCPDPDILGKSTRIQQRGRKKLFAVASSIAAVIALSLGIGVAVDKMTEIEIPSPNSYRTTLNDYKQIVLEDGSVMEMNANTEVHINFTDNLRQIQLLNGEAHFQVKKDASRPFLVDAGSVSVKAVGTAFNVRFDPDEVQVLVTEGRVSVNTVPVEPWDILENEPRSGVLHPIVPDLIAGDQATISTKGTRPVPLMSKVEMQEYEELLAWKGPRLFFDATPLEDAVQQFNEHNVIKVVVESEDLKNLSIGGSFLVEDVEAFIRLLAGDGSIVVERGNYDKVVLKPAY